METIRQKWGKKDAILSNIRLLNSSLKSYASMRSTKTDQRDVKKHDAIVIILFSYVILKKRITEIKDKIKR